MTERYGFGPGFGQGGPAGPGGSGGPGGPGGPPPDVPAYGTGAGGATRRPAVPQPHDDWQSGFGAPGGDAHVDAQAFGKPPLSWLGGAAVVALVGLTAAVLFGSGIAFAAAAWFAAGPVAIGLLAVYAHRDTQQRARAVYDELPQAKVGYWAVAAVALAGTLVSGWQIAQWVGRL